MNKNYKMYKSGKNIVFASTAVLATATTMLVNAEHVSADSTNQENSATKVSDTNTDTNTVTLNKTSTVTADSETDKTQKSANAKPSETPDKNTVVTDGETQRVPNGQHKATIANSEKDDSKKAEETRTEVKEFKSSNNVRKETKPVSNLTTVTQKSNENNANLVTNSETKRDNNKGSSTSEKVVKTANLNDNQNDEISSKWGTSDVSFNTKTRILTVQTGTIINNSSSYIDNNSKIKKYLIKIIIFNGHVTAPKDASFLFNGGESWNNSTFANLKSIEGNLDVSNVTDMRSMFFSAENLINLDVSKWDTSNVTDMSSMFYRARNLINLDVSKWDTSNVTDMSSMFIIATTLSNLDVSKWDTGNVTDMSSMFYRAENLINLDVSKWDTSNVTDMSSMFYRALTVTNLDVSKWNTSKVNNMTGMFDTAVSLTKLDVSKWDTGNVTDMSRMFFSAENLINLDVSKWNTGNVTNMGGMFGGTTNLTNLDVSKWDTSNVTFMGDMFGGTTNLTNLDVSKWDTSNVTFMGNMFTGTTNLNNLDVSKWDTGNVTDMSYMFSYALTLTNLDVSKWNTSKVKNMTSMFSTAVSLTKLDVSNWDISQGPATYAIFENDVNLSTLILGRKSLFVGEIEYSPEEEIDFAMYKTLLPFIDTSTGEYTGRWVRIDPEEPKQTYENSDVFMENYDGSMPGTYVWEKVNTKSAGVTVKYQDEQGKQIAGPETLQGNVDDTYMAKEKAIAGYTFKAVKDNNATGKFTKDTQIVIMIYTKDEVPVKQGTVTAKYQDTNGKTISADKVLTGDIDTAYQAEKQAIDGYTLKEIQGNATGKYTEADQTVTYVYTKDATQGTATIQYVDIFRNKLSAAFVLIGNIGEPIVSSAKEIKGYKLVKVEKSGELFTRDAESVTYIYVKDDSKPDNGLNKPDEGSNKSDDGSNKPDDSSSKPNKGLNRSDDGSSKQNDSLDKLSNGLNNSEYNSSELRNTVKYDNQHSNIDTDDSKKTLPNTGSDRSDNITAAGAVLAGMTVMFGMIGKAKRKEQ